MESKLVIITALVTIAIGLPAKADDRQFSNRDRMVGLLTGVDCRVRKGDLTEEQASEVMKQFARENPELNAVYPWATTSEGSYKAWEAVKLLAPYMNSECDGINLSQEKVPGAIQASSSMTSLNCSSVGRT